MTVTLRPDIERMIQEQLKAGSFNSVEELVNTVLEQFMSDDFAPGEMDKLLAIGEEQARQGKLVDGEKVFDRLRERSKNRRKGA